MVCHEECVKTGVAPVGVLQKDVVVDCVTVADAGQHPLSLDSMAVSIQHIAGERIRVGNDDRRTTVDFVAELHQIFGDGVVVKQLCLDSVRPHIVCERAVVVIEERGNHGDFRADKLTVGKADCQVINIPSRTGFGSGSGRGGLVQTPLETEVGRIGSRHKNELGEVNHLMAPPCVVIRNRRYGVRLPDGIHLVR